MLTKAHIEGVIRELVDHAYNSGYYSGQGIDGTPLHRQAMSDRESARQQVIDLVVRLARDWDALLVACKTAHKTLKAADDCALLNCIYEIEQLRAAIAAAEPNAALPNED